MNIRARFGDHIGQFSQCTLAVVHIHFQLSNELLIVIFSPFHRHVLVWLFLIAAYVWTGFTVYH
ncbi:Uncharacterised protein [Vibrio cholerae]|nr:Uncharacterised protein [Vibrio cholerae]CSA98985.1 Uncharacterised protein [Vibrio cholerae]CSC04356.1 Uncharacterised protein [Vibrio cholerae]CSD13796.1 Uncharacterised protein [Vibrio cholerae]